MTGGKFSRDKGARFEREIVHELQDVVNRVYTAQGKEAPTLRRNLQQYQEKHNADISGIPWLALECKRCETLQINQWWEQTLNQTGLNAIPVLVWKQSRQPIRVMKYADLGHGVTCPVTITFEDFLQWFMWELKGRIKDE